MTREGYKRFLPIAFGAIATLSFSCAFADHDRYHHDDRVLDSRYHHDHYYLPHGHEVAVLPHAAITVRVSGGPYYFHEGIWYRPHGPRFIVAAPPLGVVVPILPPFYTTLWVHGVPYYYANDVYYTWHPESHGYAVTDPPPDGDVTVNTASAPAGGSAPPGDNLFIYPKNNQNEQQQSTDRYECHAWANDQTHYDPTRPGGGVTAGDPTVKRSEYFRAMSACLEGRGYTVK